MAVTFLDRAKVTVASAPGNGDVSLGTAVGGFLAFGAAGAQDGATISYVIEDGAAWEIGRGTYVAAGPTLKRTSVLRSSLGGTTALNASAAAVVYSTLLAEDIADIYSAIAAVASSAAPPAAAPTYKYYKFNFKSNDGYANSAVAFAEIALYDASGNKQTTTVASAQSTFQSDTPSQALDGDPNTFWSSSDNTLPETFTLTYSTAFAATKVYILARNDDAYQQGPITFDLLGSNDGSTFTACGSYAMPSHYVSGGAQGVAVSTTSTAPVAPTTFNFLRLLFTHSGRSGSYAMAEVYASDATGTQITPSSAAASSTYSGLPASQAIDGNAETLWSNANGATPTNFDLIYGSAITPKSITIQARDDDTYYSQAPDGFTLLGSADNGVTFVNLGSYTMPAFTSAKQIQSVGVNNVSSNIVQEATVANSSDGSITLPNAPTPGNLLIALIAHYRTNVSAASGWTVVPSSQNAGSTNDGNIIVYKAAANGDTAKLSPLSGSIDQMNLALYEISGAGAVSLGTSPGEQSGAAETYPTLTPTSHSLVLYAASRSADNLIPTFAPSISVDSQNTTSSRSIICGHTNVAANVAQPQVTATWSQSGLNNVMSAVVAITP